MVRRFNKTDLFISVAHNYNYCGMYHKGTECLTNVVQREGEENHLLTTILYIRIALQELNVLSSSPARKSHKYDEHK